MSDGLDLAAIRARAEAPQCRDSSGSRPLRCGDLDLHGSFHCPECRTAKDVLALVDELETLRAKIAAGGAEWTRMAEEYDTLRGKAAACDDWRRRAETAEAAIEGA